MQTELQPIINDKGIVNEYLINVCGIHGRIFRAEDYPGQDKWLLQVGGFYNWFKPLDEVVILSQKVMTKLALQRIDVRFRQLKRDIAKKRKHEKI